jgi:hypothetical protein
VVSKVNAAPPSGIGRHRPAKQNHDLTKAEASKEIDRLQAKTGRGRKPRRTRKASQRSG